jgi:hypothetical protein
MLSFISHWRTPLDRNPSVAPAFGKVAESRFSLLFSLLVVSIRLQHSATKGD